MDIYTTQTINLPLEKTWEIFGIGFADISKWARFVQSSRPKLEGPFVGDATISGRICETGLGTLDETFLIFSNDNHELKFRVKSKGFPFFMKAIESHWQFFEDGGQTFAKSHIKMHLLFPFRYLVGWKLKRDFQKAVREVGPELEAYAGTG